MGVGEKEHEERGQGVLDGYAYIDIIFTVLRTFAPFLKETNFKTARKTALLSANFGQRALITVIIICEIMTV